MLTGQKKSFRLRIDHELIRDEMIRRLQLATVLLGMMAIGFIGAWLLVSMAFQ
jgi:nitrate reductase NapE component